ncbi:MAG: GH1 family beta-glucosidase [Acidimicrobiales bacterium]
MTDTAARTNPPRFPPDFIWGVATSSYQIEGGADVDGKGESIWDRFCTEPGRIADGTTGADGVDHYHRWPEDVTLMAELGVDAYRFSISWPRVIPNGTGTVNKAGLDFYDRLVDALLAKGITPLPTLYHWDLPQALQEAGGWPVRDTAHAFADYAEVVARRLGDRIGTWLTLNEPFVAAHLGHVLGIHAPGHTSTAEGFAASHHLLLAHGLAVERLRQTAPESRVGIVLNFTPAVPGTDSEADRIEAERINDRENRWYVEPIAGMGYPERSDHHRDWDRREVLEGDLDIISAPIDVLGVNYYTRHVVFTEPPADDSWRHPTTEMGWEIHPPTFGDLLIDLHQTYGFDAMVVTENGAAMADTERRDGYVDDQDRIDFLHDHIAQVHRAMVEGAPIEGYLVWSLLDNFEWAEGFAKRFGIVEVDFETYERRLKSSAFWYADLVRTGVLTR